MATPTKSKPKKFKPGATFDYTNSGVNYFKDSKVGSATGFISCAGQVLAVPHRSRSATSLRNRADGLSEYQHNFRESAYCYCSMDRKPLCPYDPLSYRSRLAVEDAPVPYKNASIVNFDGGIHICHKKRFNTINRTCYTGEPSDPRSNQGILSENRTFKRFLMEK